MSEQDLVLEVRHVSGGYCTPSLFGRGKSSYKEVLHDVDFVVRHGEILGLVGESGTGKSTLARIILGLVQPEKGQVIHHTPRPQIIFQDPYSSLNPAYTVEWSIEEPLRIYGKYDAAERKRHGGNHRYARPFLCQNRQKGCHHYRRDEQERAGQPRIHETECAEQSQGRESEKASGRRHHANVAAWHRQRLPCHRRPQAEHRRRHDKPSQQHGVRPHAVCNKIVRPEGVGAVADGGNDGCYDTE